MTNIKDEGLFRPFPTVEECEQRGALVPLRFLRHKKHRAGGLPLIELTPDSEFASAKLDELPFWGDRFPEDYLEQAERMVGTYLLALHKTQDSQSALLMAEGTVTSYALTKEIVLEAIKRMGPSPRLLHRIKRDFRALKYAAPAIEPRAKEGFFKHLCRAAAVLTL